MAPDRDPLFLDHCSTTPPLPAVLEEYGRVAGTVWGNPASPHGTGRAAYRELERARALLAESIGSRPAEVVFCSSGTEANNLAIQGTIGHALLHETDPVHAIAGADSHASVLEPLRLLARHHPDRFQYDLLPVDQQGIYRWNLLDQLVTTQTRLLCLLHLNNETGVVQDLTRARSVSYAHPRMRLMVDWVQSHGKWPLDLRLEAMDLLTCSAHKIHGVRGSALLFIRAGTELEPVIVGGAQEKYRRAGTVDVAAAAAYARAVQLALPPEEAWLGQHQLERHLLDTLSDHGTEYIVHGPQPQVTLPPAPQRLPGFLNLAFPAMANKEDLLIALDLEGIHASSTSACHSGLVSDSHVLTAMGVPPALRASSIRIAFSTHQSPADAVRAGNALARIVARAQTVPQPEMAAPGK